LRRFAQTDKPFRDAANVKLVEFMIKPAERFTIIQPSQPYENGVHEVPMLRQIQFSARWLATRSATSERYGHQACHT
jgi:hypothetical protein